MGRGEDMGETEGRQQQGMSWTVQHAQQSTTAKDAKRLRAGLLIASDTQPYSEYPKCHTRVLRAPPWLHPPCPTHLLLLQGGQGLAPVEHLLLETFPFKLGVLKLHTCMRAGCAHIWSQTGAGVWDTVTFQSKAHHKRVLMGSAEPRLRDKLCSVKCLLAHSMAKPGPTHLLKHIVIHLDAKALEQGDRVLWGNAAGSGSEKHSMQGIQNNMMLPNSVQPVVGTVTT